MENRRLAAETQQTVERGPRDLTAKARLETDTITYRTAKRPSLAYVQASSPLSPFPSYRTVFPRALIQLETPGVACAHPYLTKSIPHWNPPSLPLDTHPTVNSALPFTLTQGTVKLTTVATPARPMLSANAT